MMDVDGEDAAPPLPPELELNSGDGDRVGWLAVELVDDDDGPPDPADEPRSLGGKTDLDGRRVMLTPSIELPFNWRRRGEPSTCNVSLLCPFMSDCASGCEEVRMLLRRLLKSDERRESRDSRVGPPKEGGGRTLFSPSEPSRAVDVWPLAAAPVPLLVVSFVDEALVTSTF